MVHENIFPGIAPDESVALLIVKPLYHTLFFHFASLIFLYSKSYATRRDSVFCFRSIRNPRGVEPQRRGPTPAPDLLGSSQRKQLSEIDPEYTCKFYKKQLLRRKTIEISKPRKYRVSAPLRAADLNPKEGTEDTDKASGGNRRNKCRYRDRRSS